MAASFPLLETVTRTMGSGLKVPPQLNLPVKLHHGSMAMENGRHMVGSITFVPLSRITTSGVRGH